jgi:hypothetical protein
MRHQMVRTSHVHHSLNLRAVKPGRGGHLLKRSTYKCKQSDDNDARGWDLSSSTYGWATPRKGLQGCTAALGGGNGGAYVLPLLLGETMPRGFKEAEDW